MRKINRFIACAMAMLMMFSAVPAGQLLAAELTEPTVPISQDFLGVEQYPFIDDFIDDIDGTKEEDVDIDDDDHSKVGDSYVDGAGDDSGDPTTESKGSDDASVELYESFSQVQGYSEMQEIASLSLQEIAAINAANLAAFPASYQPMIQALMNARPNWIFEPAHTGLDWNAAVRSEMTPFRNVVPINAPASWRAPGNPSEEAGWVQATQPIVEHFMDPRNFLNEASVFQFELLTFNSTIHNEAAVEAVLAGSFMHRQVLGGHLGPNAPGRDASMTYAQAFMQIGRELNVNPIFLAMQVRQEQGVNGGTHSISGSHPVHPGWFNYFNLRATPPDPHLNAMLEARANGWNTRFAALRGGALNIANTFIAHGQNTMYFQKFLFQIKFPRFYAANLQSANSKGIGVHRAYRDMGLLNNQFVFRIPIYNNMPATAVPMPTESPNLLPPSGINQLSLSYRAHVQSIGWLSPVSEGRVSGTAGRSLRVEAFELSLLNAPAGAGIEYSAHVQDIGWQDWRSNGALAGTSGQARRVEAIRINLRGMPSDWNVFYRTHVQNVGWTGWSSNGAASGTTGRGLQVEAIQVIVMQGGLNADLQRWTDDHVRTSNPSLSYRSHVQNVGWQARVSNGHVSGTSGRGLRVEAFDLLLVNAPPGASIEYSAHVQDIGWQAWRSNGAMAGTSGQARRIEAIRINLGGLPPDWNVYYRTHVQNVGWTNWSSNGAISGTTGRGLRIEAIQVVICQGPLDLSLVR